MENSGSGARGGAISGITFSVVMPEKFSNRTKIVCTIGPASSAASVVRDMLKAGMDVARINFSHADHDSNLQLMETIRAAAKKLGRPVAILQDLQGPKIRVGVLPGAGLNLVEGSLVKIRVGVLEADHGVIPVPYKRLAADVRRGDRILLDDGTKELEVVHREGSGITAKVLLGGRLISHKGLNVPTRTLSVESITEKDEEDLAFGLKHNVDFVALSFVRSAEDVKKLRSKIKRLLPADTEPPHIIVKIEKHEALQQFDDILDAADGVMIARGDLGLETPAALVPVRQKELIAKCVVAGKPVITATEMLASMVTNPRPTRAEVSDVANAVLDHSDAVMLSGESASGRFPVRAVSTMAEIIQQTEESPLDGLRPHRDATGQPVPFAVAAAAVELARHVDAKAILVTSHTGYSARAVVRFRPKVTIYAVTDSPRVRNQLLLSWGVVPLLVDDYGHPERMAHKAMEQLRTDKRIKKGDRLVVVSGLARASGGFDSGIRVVEVA